MPWLPLPPSARSSTIPGIAPTYRPFGRLREAAAAVATAPVVDTRVSNQQISVALAANLGIGTIFGGSISSNEVGYWLDAMAYTDQFEQEPEQGSLVVATRFGFGLRVMFRVTTIDGKLNLNYGLIGAALDAQAATASYEIEGIGLGADALGTILAGLTNSGALNGDAYYTINSDILKNLVDYIKAHIAELEPQRVAALVQSSATSDSLNISQAVLFAKRQIRSGNSLKDALSAAGDLDSVTIRLVYGTDLGNVPDDTKPTRQQSEVASEWLADN